MRIAICDDDPNDLAILHTAIQRFDKDKTLEVCPFTSASELFNAEKIQPFDIAILDIEMPSPNGYEIAKRLIEHHPAPIIIFLTNSMAYAIRGYGIAFRYLPKPIDSTQFDKALCAAICEATANRFFFSIDGTAHIIPIPDIYYFEVFGHQTILHTMSSSYAFRATLKDILKQLPPGYFGAPHQSYIVNFAHAKTATTKEIHLTNGVVIPISRRKQQDFEHQLYAYLGR